MKSSYLNCHPIYCVITWNNLEILIDTLLERFSIECRKTKTKVITLANHKGHRQYSEPIKARSNYM